MAAEWWKKDVEATHERVIRAPPERPINRANRAHPRNWPSPLYLEKQWFLLR